MAMNDSAAIQRGLDEIESKLQRIEKAVRAHDTGKIRIEPDAIEELTYDLNQALSELRSLRVALYTLETGLKGANAMLAETRQVLRQLTASPGKGQRSTKRGESRS